MTPSLEYVIRPLTPADEPFLWEMLYLAIYLPPGGTPPDKAIVHQPEIARYVQGWGRPDDSGFIAVDSASQQPIGAAWLRLLTGENKSYGYVDDATPELTIAVLPEHRGKGVGTRLLTCVLDAARARYPSVSLSVSAENPALRLYRRMGFEVVGRGDMSLTMKKDAEKQSTTT